MINPLRASVTRSRPLTSSVRSTPFFARPSLSHGRAFFQVTLLFRLFKEPYPCPVIGSSPMLVSYFLIFPFLTTWPRGTPPFVRCFSLLDKRAAVFRDLPRSGRKALAQATLFLLVAASVTSPPLPSAPYRPVLKSTRDFTRPPIPSHPSYVRFLFFYHLALSS